MLDVSMFKIHMNLKCYVVKYTTGIYHLLYKGKRLMLGFIQGVHGPVSWTNSCTALTYIGLQTCVNHD